MLFSSPDYPPFLIAVFFLYALARWGSAAHAWARIAMMVLLADIVFLLIAKDPNLVWDPVGGMLCKLATGNPEYYDVPLWLAARWAIGSALLVGMIVVGRRKAAWIASSKGQAALGVGLVAILAAVGITVIAGTSSGTLPEITDAIVEHGHLVVLFVLGAGIGVSAGDEHRPLGRVMLLFVASSLFYQAWASAMPGPYRYLLALLLGTIALDYYLGIWIARTEDPWKRKALLVVSLCSNLGILVVFKYADFFTQDVLQLDVERLNLILPAGISFHTFQSLSYTIDVYRRELPATKSVITFATFVLFFPQLVAGPIVRAQDLLPQLEQPPALQLDKATRGLFRIVLGLFKKVALADAFAIAIVDRVFEAPERFSSVEVAVGVIGYAFQIFLDFSAYSDIAIGSAQVLGFELPENFRTPYRSANIQEFWRRWHISLSTWLRDYLYITLGGNKHGPARTYINLILTMLLGGLWHGASWAFIVWGALHGFGLAVTRFFQRATAVSKQEAQKLLAACLVLAFGGYAVQTLLLTHLSTWWQLVIAWLYLTPLWAVATAWLGQERKPPPAVPVLPFFVVWGRTPREWVPELLRITMCLSAIGVFAALEYLPSSTWIPAIVLTWALALAADIVERGSADAMDRLVYALRRLVSGVLVFAYVCLAWIFFRATSFDNALAILRQIAQLDTDHANVVPLVTVSLAAATATHLFPEGTYRWLRERFVALPSYGQGFVLACVALVLRELAHTKIVPFIYFQF
jgi:D-alanyl-lipoteichoic acid acyltransferase DltB (MBOAT superfamily)